MYAWATALAIGLLAGAASAAVDPYVCYNMVPRHGPLLALPTTNIVDAFEDRNYDFKGRWQLCAPADVEEAGTTDAVTHLLTFQVRPRPGEPRHEKRRGVLVTNVLEERSIETVRAEHVLVPVSVGQPDYLPPPDPDAIGVDHYKCYRIKTTPGTSAALQAVRLSVADTLTTPARLLAIRKPRYLCAPASIDGSATKNPSVYQMCYLARTAPGAAEHVPQPGLKVATKFPQFERPVSFQITLGSNVEDHICLPSQVTLPPP
jgi:hypothetical protein